MTLRKLKFRPTVHAIERMRDYFGTKEIHAMDYANELMQGAQHVKTQPDGRNVFKSVVQDVMLVIGDGNAIITILPPPGRGKNNAYSEPVQQAYNTANPILAAASATIKRELTKARRQFTREYRVLTEEIAVVGLEIAQLSLNKARARSPITQRHITEKVSEIHARQTQLAEQRKQLEAEYSAIKTEAQAFIGEGVGT